MPRNKPQTTGYARLAQAEEEEESDMDDGFANNYATLQATSIQQLTSNNRGVIISDDNVILENNRIFQFKKRMRTNSGVDIKAINARLEKWADEISSKFKISKSRGKPDEEEKLEIYHSVFQSPEGILPVTAEMLKECEEQRMSRHHFDKIVESVRLAIEQGIHPKMISQGSSGSYFARDTQGKIVGVFKPKDEEPYAAGNPKWNKWIHRNLFPCCFGRACLIPNLSYVSEAAAYTLDCRLQTHLVPFTDIVHLSSKSFHYDFWHRRNYYKRNRPFPPKVGSFQVFLEGYKDANIFLRENAWPDISSSVSSFNRPLDGSQQKKPQTSGACSSSTSDSRSHHNSDEDDDETVGRDKRQKKRFVWTENLKQSFREELEKLVVLDYIMRNTDRGLDNWMIKVDYKHQNISIRADSPQFHVENNEELHPRPISLTDNSLGSGSHKKKPSHTKSSSVKSKNKKGPSISIGAIDNSLSWPWKHPDAWRSFPFGWLFLPVSLIGQPFSQKTRQHFLPLLTSKQWWSDTQMELKKVFSQDVDFKERMFARQIAVMKGQAWNVVETLKLPDHGPLELTRRTRICVWDDLVDIPIAIPMKMPSGEMRVRNGNAHEEEMDISAASNSSSVVQSDLLGLITSPSELPNPNRFELASSQVSSSDETCLKQPTTDIPSDPKSQNTNSLVDSGNFTNLKSRPPFKLFRNRMSYDGPSRPQVFNSQKERRFSYNSNCMDIFSPREGEDLEEGDLGYTATEEMEGNHRKVIVERLETVKSKNPVFTWC